MFHVKHKISLNSSYLTIVVGDENVSHYCVEHSVELLPFLGGAEFQGRILLELICQ